MILRRLKIDGFGALAGEWRFEPGRLHLVVGENEKGRPWFEKERRRQQEHPIEIVGARLRQMMPFVKPVTIKPGE